MAMFDGWLIVSVGAIFLLGGTVKGVLGFGLPIITMSLLPFIIDVEKAIVLSALVQPATNVFQLVNSGRVKPAASLAWPVVVMLLPGVAFGAWLLSSLDAGAVLLIVGLTISVYAIHQLFGATFQIPSGKRLVSGFGFGLIAGIFGALTSINGWAFVIYLIGTGVDRQGFRSAIALLFLVSGFLISSSFWAIGLLTDELLLAGVLALVPSFVGMWLGNRMAQRISAETFRGLLLWALVVVGCVLAARGYGSIG